jgi:hypothetical protein
MNVELYSVGGHYGDEKNNINISVTSNVIYAMWQIKIFLSFFKSPDGVPKKS